MSCWCENIENKCLECETTEAWNKLPMTIQHALKRQYVGTLKNIDDMSIEFLKEKSKLYERGYCISMIPVSVTEGL